ncbi:MAG: PD-(D/E)XK motif protein [Firmicutes bacterium]|nr:PD-(D/E)XK motif protein [Bacillota bacterium]
MIEELWQELEAEVEQQHVTTGMIRRRIHPQDRPDISLAIERPGDVRLLLLRIPISTLPPRDMLPGAEGFVVAPVTQRDDDPNHATLMLRLSDKRYQDIFTVLVEDVVAAITSTPDDTNMLKIFLSRLLTWQRFLAVHGPEGLSKEAQQGLYGELWFLRHSLFRHTDLLIAVQAWTGPGGAPHDFQFPHCAVEVKTTSSKQPQQIRVSNERQLDETHIPALYLFHLSLDVSRTGGESLPEMVYALRKAMEGYPVVHQAFEQVLLIAGYLDAHADRYQQNRYHVREHNVFRVRDEFPRIIVRDLRAGVGDVHYAIGVAECKHFAIEDSKFITMLSGE